MSAKRLDSTYCAAILWSLRFQSAASVSSGVRPMSAQISSSVLSTRPKQRLLAACV